MPISLDTTVGGPSANSYATQAELITYISTRFPPVAWAVAAAALAVVNPPNPSSYLLNAPLIAAARELDNCFRWRGNVDPITSPSQARAFPRTGLLTRNGQPLDA